MLVTLYPALLEFAETELRKRGLNPQMAPDIVQDACRRYTELITLELAARSYMHGQIRGRVGILHREGGDVMSHQPLSLNQIEDE